MCPQLCPASASRDFSGQSLRLPMFSQPGMPCPFDAHLPLPIQMPVQPSACQLVGQQAMGVGREAWAAGQPSPPVPGTALPSAQRRSDSCPRHCSRGAGREKRGGPHRRGGYLRALHHPQFSQRNLDQRQTERGRLCPILS